MVMDNTGDNNRSRHAFLLIYGNAAKKTLNIHVFGGVFFNEINVQTAIHSTAKQCCTLKTHTQNHTFLDAR